MSKLIPKDLSAAYFFVVSQSQRNSLERSPAPTRNELCRVVVRPIVFGSARKFYFAGVKVMHPIKIYYIRFSAVSKHWTRWSRPTISFMRWSNVTWCGKVVKHGKETWSIDWNGRPSWYHCIHVGILMSYAVYRVDQKTGLVWALITQRWLPVKKCVICQKF